MNLESILAMWKQDSEIDEVQLDESSRDSAKLHSKYLDLYLFSGKSFVKLYPEKP